MPRTTYKNNVLCLGEQQGRSVVFLKDAKTGQTIWSWKDVFPSRNSQILSIGASIHVFENNLIIKDAGNTYHIDLETGKTLWKTQTLHNDGFSGLGTTGIGNLYFFPGTSGYLATLSVGDSKLQKESIFYSVSPRTLDENVNAPLVTAFVDKSSQNTLIIIPYTRLNNTTNLVSWHYVVYNFTKKIEDLSITLKLDTIKNRFGGFYGTPIIYNNRVFFAVGSSILCCDLASGTQLWRKDFPADFLFSGITLAEDKIIGNCENEIMYALNPESGDILWQEPSSGTSSTPFFMNGVIYLAGGGDGIFHAIDATTGKHIWRIASPENSGNGRFFFDYVTGADGKVFVSSRTTMYCYKAAR
jgi:outer membrane protein assembly factor BamB